LCTMPAFACGREKPRDTFLWKARGKVEIWTRNLSNLEAGKFQDISCCGLFNDALNIENK
jgi:hypothetical protein